MFFVYLRRELRRRMRQAIVIALGLAIGIGLVITVADATAGVQAAQSDVLHSLYGVGTDITVTKSATPGSGGGFHVGGFGAGSGSGTRKISRNTLQAAPGQATLPESDVATIASLPHASAATGVLELNNVDFSGTIPGSAASAPAAGSGATPGASSSSSDSSSGSGPAFNINSFSVDGVPVSGTDVGPLTASQITSGSYFAATDATADVAIVSSSYATQNKLTVGSHLTIGGKPFTVIGIADVSSGAADTYIPLGTAQSLSGLTGDVSTIFVSASSASEVSGLATSIKAAAPGSTVSTSATLANEVSGSLSSASKLASGLGTWLSVAALVVAFLIAGLLMVAAVSRRVREFGTLKAIGWRTRRVVEQVMGEGLALGIIGGILGIVLGVAGSAIISAISPTLSATTGTSFATGGGGGPSGGPGGPPGASAHTIPVHLTAPLQGGTVALAVVLAIVGGLVAGAFGSWRAARLRPADALRRVE